MIIEDRYLDVRRGVDTPTEAGVRDLWTGQWKCKHLDASLAAQTAQEANESFRKAAQHRIAQAPDELELELLLAVREGTMLEHNAWTWRFYERMGFTEWRSVPPSLRNTLWHWRQGSNVALVSRSRFDEVKKPNLGFFQQLMLSPVGAAWLDAHYPNR